MIYFDTSYLVRLYSKTPALTRFARSLLPTILPRRLTVRRNVRGLSSQAARRGQTSAAYAALLGQVQAHIGAGAFRWLSQDEQVFTRIRHVYRKLPRGVFLRAADAIHLATAAESGFPIVYSNDARLLATAQHFGIQGKNILS